MIGLVQACPGECCKPTERTVNNPTGVEWTIGKGCDGVKGYNHKRGLAAAVLDIIGELPRVRSLRKMP